METWGPGVPIGYRTYHENTDNEQGQEEANENPDDFKKTSSITS